MAFSGTPSPTEVGHSNAQSRPTAFCEKVRGWKKKPEKGTRSTLSLARQAQAYRNTPRHVALHCFRNRRQIGSHAGEKKEQHVGILRGDRSIHRPGARDRRTSDCDTASAQAVRRGHGRKPARRSHIRTHPRQLPHRWPSITTPIHDSKALFILHRALSPSPFVDVSGPPTPCSNLTIGGEVYSFCSSRVAGETTAAATTRRDQEG